MMVVAEGAVNADRGAATLSVATRPGWPACTSCQAGSAGAFWRGAVVASTLARVLVFGQHAGQAALKKAGVDGETTQRSSLPASIAVRGPQRTRRSSDPR